MDRVLCKIGLHNWQEVGWGNVLVSFISYRVCARCGKRDCRSWNLYGGGGSIPVDTNWLDGEEETPYIPAWITVLAQEVGDE